MSRVSFDPLVAPKQVEVSTLDVADMGETKQIVGIAEGLAPVGGIFHLAMVLQDRWLSNQVHTCARARLIRLSSRCPARMRQPFIIRLCRGDKLHQLAAYCWF